MPKAAARQESNQAELSLTIGLIENILTSNKTKDQMVSLETFESEMEYTFSWKDLTVKLERKQSGSSGSLSGNLVHLDFILTPGIIVHPLFSQVFPLGTFIMETWGNIGDFSHLVIEFRIHQLIQQLSSTLLSQVPVFFLK